MEPRSKAPPPHAGLFAGPSLESGTGEWENVPSCIRLAFMHLHTLHVDSTAALTSALQARDAQLQAATQTVARLEADLSAQSLALQTLSTSLTALQG